MRGVGRIEPGGPGTVELRMDSRPENLALARLALGGVASVAAAPEAAIADLKVAVTEACTNAIQHAHTQGAAGSIVVRYRAAGGVLEVEVEDEGSGFDPLDPGAPEGQDGEGQGMGLMIIRALTDETVVESDETGSRIAFSKRLEP
jgi:serine/threonine-protein kinase RsbW